MTFHYNTSIMMFWPVQDAGVAYKHCGRLEERLKKPEVAASFYHEAALCFQKDDPQEAAACLLHSINLYCQMKRFSTAARLETEVAKLMEKDRNPPLAIIHYIKAADFYRANTCCDKAADRCLLEAAHALGACERYVEAASLFQEVGRRILADDLLKFNSTDAFLKAVLCLQCASGMPARESQPHRRNPTAEPPPPPRPTTSSVRATLLSLGKSSSIFRGSRAYLFASDMTQAGKDGDVPLFAARVYAYDNVCRLDAWYLRILKIVHGHVEEKSARNQAILAAQAKLRRRQLEAERARTRRSRQRVSMENDDSSEGTLSQGTRSNASSSEAIPSAANGESNTTKTASSAQAGSSSSDSSASGSDPSSSGSSSSSGTGSGSSSSSSSADDSSSSRSGSGGSSEGSGSGSDDSSGSGSSTSGEGEAGGHNKEKSAKNDNSKRSAGQKKNKKKSVASRDRSGEGSSSSLSSTGSGSSGNSGGSKSTPDKTKTSKTTTTTTTGGSLRGGSESESEYSQEDSDSGSKEGSVARAGSGPGKQGGGKISSRKKRVIDGKKVIDKKGKGKGKSGFWRKG